MAIIRTQDTDRLKRDFRKSLKKEVTLRLFTQSTTILTIPGQECASCGQTQELLEQIAGLSPKVELKIYNFYTQPDEKVKWAVDRIPAVVLGEGGDGRAKFYGMPIGYQLTTLIDDIKILSRGVNPLSMNTRKQLRTLTKQIHILVFVTPDSKNCIEIARLAHALAFDSPMIASDVVEVQEFPRLGQAYAVRGVPKVVISSPSSLLGTVPQVQFSGPISESQFVDGVLEVGRPDSTSNPSNTPAWELTKSFGGRK